MLLVSRVCAELAIRVRKNEPTSSLKKEKDFMKLYCTLTITITLLLLVPHILLAQHCPLDHLAIGCNEDGVLGTEDDRKLFADCTEKYRHSDPNQSGEPTWLNWYYPLYYNERLDCYEISEPGFETIEDDDPNRQLQGVAGLDYRIVVQCISITPGFVVENSGYGILLDEAGDWLNYTALLDHVHLRYRAPASAGATRLHWVTYQIYDTMADGQQYEDSDPLTVVFVREPLAGDLAVDGTVNAYDIVGLSRYWLAQNCSLSNDFCERSDSDKSGSVDFIDFAFLASNWLKSMGQ